MYDDVPDGFDRIKRRMLIGAIDADRNSAYPQGLSSREVYSWMGKLPSEDGVACAGWHCPRAVWTEVV
jgi:hypothetical protein